MHWASGRDISRFLSDALRSYVHRFANKSNSNNINLKVWQLQHRLKDSYRKGDLRSLDQEGISLISGFICTSSSYFCFQEFGVCHRDGRRISEFGELHFNILSILMSL